MSNSAPTGAETIVTLAEQRNVDIFTIGLSTGVDFDWRWRELALTRRAARSCLPKRRTVDLDL